MPYINQEDRPEIDLLVNSLLVEMQSAGHLNYTITKLLDGWVEQPSYTAYNTVMGVLECVKQEYYRRVVAEYENIKRMNNGDVF